MAEATLARQYVEFVQKGFEKVEATTNKMKERLDHADRAAKNLQKSCDSGAFAGTATMFGKISGAVTNANEKFSQLAGVVRQGAAMIAGPASMAFGVLTGTVMGFVRAGLAGSVEGYRLQFAFGQLSKEIAGVFLPVVQKITSWIEKVTNWFRKLTGTQQDMIMKVTLVSAALLAVAIIIPMVIAGVVGLIAGVLSLTASLVAMDAALMGIPLLIGVIVTAIVSLLTAMGVMVGAGAGMVAMSDKSSSAMKMLGNILDNLWTKVKIIADAMMSWWRILGNLFEISMKLAGALFRPFEKFFSRHVGGGNGFLETFADMLDRIANFMDDWIVPAFEALGNIIERNVNAALENMSRLIDFVVERANRLLAVFGKIGAADKFFAMTRASKKDGDGHRRPMPMDTGFEDAVGTWKRLAQAAMKTAAATMTPEDKTAKNTEEMAVRVKEIETKIIEFFTNVEKALNVIAGAITNPIGTAAKGFGIPQEVMKPGRMIADMVKAQLK